MAELEKAGPGSSKDLESLAVENASLEKKMEENAAYMAELLEKEFGSTASVVGGISRSISAPKVVQQDTRRRSTLKNRCRRSISFSSDIDISTSSAKSKQPDDTDYTVSPFVRIAPLRAGG